MFFVFGLLLQIIFLGPSLLVWAVCKRFSPRKYVVNSYLATFVCFIMAIATAFLLKVEFEGGLITGVIVFSVFTFIYSLVLSIVIFIYKTFGVCKNV